MRAAVHRRWNQAPSKRLHGFHADLDSTLLYFVSPHKLIATLEDACAVFGGERRCCLARELTKMHEELFRSTLQGALEEFTARAPRGEFTVVIEGAKDSTHAELTDDEVLDALRRALEGGNKAPSHAVKEVAQGLGVSRNRVYSLVLSLEET